MSKRFKKQEQGFTLVELLVVIGIIAILTAIAVPMFLSQRQAANTAALRSDMVNVATEVHTWFVDNPNGSMEPDESRGYWSMILLGEGGRFTNGYRSGSPEDKIPEGFDVPPLTDGVGMGLLARGVGYELQEGGPGSFCILGNMENSDYVVPDGWTGESDESRWAFSMFYDSKAGGLHTTESLPPDGACHQYYSQIHSN